MGEWAVAATAKVRTNLCAFWGKVGEKSCGGKLRYCKKGIWRDRGGGIEGCPIF